MRQNNQVDLNLGTEAKGEAPSIAAQGTEARAAKAVGLTSGDLRCVSATRLRSLQGDLTAAQKSAEGIVGGSVPPKARTVEVAGER